MDMNGHVQTVSGGQHAVTALAWDATSSQLASACGSTSICVWRLSGNPRTFSTLIARFAGHTDVVRSLAFSRDGQMVVSTADDDTARLGSVRMLDPAFAQLPLDNGTVVTALDMSPDRRWLAAGDDHGNTHVWSIDTQTMDSSFSAMDQQIDAIAWSPDGSRLGLGGDGGAVALLDRSKLNVSAASPALSGPITGLLWLRDKSGILVSGESDGSIHMVSSDAPNTCFRINK